MHRLVSVALLLGMVQVLCARVATVRTIDGQRFSGQVRLTKQGVVVVNSAQSLMVTVRATNIAAVSFPDGATPPEREEALFGVLPASWHETEIGASKPPGSTRCEQTTFTVRGAGAGFDTEGDSFHYVYQPVHGDHAIVARVNTMQYTHPAAKAGLMMRETMSEYSRDVSVSVTANRGGTFQARYFESRAPEITPQPDMRPPYWLKLRRRGQEFAGFKSRDGRQWTLIEKRQVPIGEDYYVGLAVASAREGVLNWTTFDHVRTAVKLGNQEFTPQVELTSGSVITGTPAGIDGPELNFVGGPRAVPVPLARVSRVIYQPLTPEMAWKTRASRPGVWVQGGDFFEGELRELSPEKLRVSSVLYGWRTFDVADEVQALVLGYGNRSRPTVEIEAVDGSILFGTGAAFGDGEIAFKEAALGQVHLPAFSIRELRLR